MKTIYFDMDGTFVNLYGVENWLDYIINKSSKPYDIALPLFNMNSFAKAIHKLQKSGYKVGIISWCAKDSNSEYDNRVINSKKKWLKKHLKSVEFDEIHILEYGTPKYMVANENDILFDDEINNRENWRGVAYGVDNILNTMKSLVSS